MKIESFGEYIRHLREEKKLPLRKVAAHLDIDTSTLSKVEKGDRPISLRYLKPLSAILDVNLKDLQVKFVADAISKEYGQLEYLVDGLKEAESQYLKSKK